MTPPLPVAEIDLSPFLEPGAALTWLESRHAALAKAPDWRDLPASGRAIRLSGLMDSEARVLRIDRLSQAALSTLLWKVERLSYTVAQVIEGFIARAEKLEVGAEALLRPHLVPWALAANDLQWRALTSDQISVITCAWMDAGVSTDALVDRVTMLNAVQDNHVRRALHLARHCDR